MSYGKRWENECEPVGHSTNSYTHSSGPASNKPVTSPSYSDITSSKSNRSRSYNDAKPFTRAKDFVGTRSMEGRTLASSSGNEGKKILAKRKENLTKGKLFVDIHVHVCTCTSHLYIFGN